MQLPDLFRVAHHDSPTFLSHEFCGHPLGRFIIIIIIIIIIYRYSTGTTGNGVFCTGTPGTEISGTCPALAKAWDTAGERCGRCM